MSLFSSLLIQSSSSNYNVRCFVLSTPLLWTILKTWNLRRQSSELNGFSISPVLFSEGKDLRHMSRTCRLSRAVAERMEEIPPRFQDSGADFSARADVACFGCSSSMSTTFCEGHPFMDTSSSHCAYTKPTERRRNGSVEKLSSEVAGVVQIFFPKLSAPPARPYQNSDLPNARRAGMQFPINEQVELKLSCVRLSLQARQTAATTIRIT